MYPALAFNMSVMILRRVHAIFGTLVFLGGMVTLWLGLCSTWFTNNVHRDGVLAVCFACPVVVTLHVMIQVSRKVLRRRAR